MNVTRQQKQPLNLADIVWQIATAATSSGANPSATKAADSGESKPKLLTRECGHEKEGG